jgi:hypothetical protein
MNKVIAALRSAFRWDEWKFNLQYFGVTLATMAVCIVASKFLRGPAKELTGSVALALWIVYGVVPGLKGIFLYARRRLTED